VAFRPLPRNTIRHSSRNSSRGATGSSERRSSVGLEDISDTAPAPGLGVPTKSDVDPTQRQSVEGQLEPTALVSPVAGGGFSVISRGFRDDYRGILRDTGNGACAGLTY
jgi:hypothetical protein